MSKSGDNENVERNDTPFGLNRPIYEGKVMYVAIRVLPHSKHTETNQPANVV
jgi:hypothetical protein